MTEKTITVTVDPRMVPASVFEGATEPSHFLPIPADSELADIDQVTSDDDAGEECSLA